jgi:hypothetical protein
MSGRDTTRDLQNAPDWTIPPPSTVLPSASGQPNMAASATPASSILDRNYAVQLARESYQSSTNWINSGKRVRWTDSLRMFQGQHPSGSKYLGDDYRYRSKLFRPKTRSMVRKDEAQTALALFSNEDVVSITAQDDDDQNQQASAALLKSALQYRLTKTIPWFMTVMGARQDADTMGICVLKPYWKYAEKFSHTESRPHLDPQTQMPMMDPETGEMASTDFDIYHKTQDHPWIDLIAPENIRFDPGADWRNPIATSPYIIELIPMYICDVREKIKNGEFFNVSDSSLFSATDLDDDTTRRARELGRVPGKDHDSWKPKPFDICWIRENIIRVGGQDWHYFTLGFGGELLTEPTSLGEVYLHGIRPYVCGCVIPEAHKTYPSSKVDLIRDLQTETNDVMNLRLDNVKLALNPRQFIAAGQGIDPSDIRTFMPGKVVIMGGKMAPRDAVEWDRPPDVTGSAYQEQDRINLDFDELTGNMDNSSIQANRQVLETVGNMQMMAGNASQVGEYEMRVFVETAIEPCIRQLVLLEQAYETDPVVLALAGKDAKLVQKFGINQITDDLLKQELTVRVNVGMGATNPQMKLKNFLTATQAIGQLFGPAASMGGNFEECVKEVFGLCGYKDGARFFMPGFDVHQAQQQMAQGKQKGNPQQEHQQMMMDQQAEQQRQQMESRMRMAELQQQYALEMKKLETQSALKDKDMQLKVWLKMQEIQMQIDAEKQKQTQQIAHETNMASQAKPAATIQFNAEDHLNDLANNIQGMAGQHGQMLNNLHGALKPIGGALSGIAQMMHGQHQQHLSTTHHLAQSNESIAAALRELAKPKKRRAIRDPKTGKLEGAEEYV